MHTVIYPSPESELMKTMAVAAALATAAPELAESVVEVVNVAPSLAAWTLIASYGAVKYCTRSAHEFFNFVWSYRKLRSSRAPSHGQRARVTISIGACICP